MYMPPKGRINKDFLKQVFSEQKQLLPRSEVKFIRVPDYDELSVKAIWKDVKGDPELSRYFPDDPNGLKLPPREYFFNVLNSVQPEFVKSIVSHACSLR